MWRKWPKRWGPLESLLEAIHSGSIWTTWCLSSTISYIYSLSSVRIQIMRVTWGHAPKEKEMVIGISADQIKMSLDSTGYGYSPFFTHLLDQFLFNSFFIHSSTCTLYILKNYPLLLPLWVMGLITCYKWSCSTMLT